MPIENKKQICRILMPSHNLAIEHWRLTNIPINNPNCKLRYSGIQYSDIEDEFHFRISTTLDVNTKRSIIGKIFSFFNIFSC